MAPRLSARCPPISLIGGSVGALRRRLVGDGVVSAVQDQPSGWSGPRFTGRDATLLHPLSKPRVDGEWVAAVYAVHDYTPDPPGDRGLRGAGCHKKTLTTHPNARLRLHLENRGLSF
ncbi:unnamed protein product [Boreogadus saida]